MSDSDSRLVDLEVIVMHLQHDYEQLNGELIQQQNTIQSQQQQIKRLETLIHQFMEQGGAFPDETENS